jgi:hypothetical protein
MNMDLDERIATVLRENAPPQRDAMFRIAVLERLERQRFKRRLSLLAVAAAAVVVLVSLGYGARSNASGSIGVLLLCAVLAVSVFRHAPVLTHFARRWRNRDVLS